ncbi:response regulator [Lachnospiraceae bacterium LCP25S3_G4]
MGLYKLLLADDEEEIRDGIIQKLDWKSLGFEVVSSADNGVEALEVLEQTALDVIMTDIRMPFMDGLEFIEKAVEMQPAVKIIVFSGFDDFEYAQRAIKLGVEEYILKPVSAKQLEDALKKLKDKMDAELEKKRNINRLLENYEESFPVMREQFLISLMEGYVTKEQVEIKATQYHVNTAVNYWTIVLVSADEAPITDEVRLNHSFYGKEELIPISLKQIIDGILGRFHKINSFFYSDQIVVIVELEWETEISRLMNEVNEVCKEGKKIIGLDIAAGIGGLYSELTDLMYSYEEAGTALEYSALFCKEGNHTAYIKDIEPEERNIRIQFGEKEERVLVHAIKTGNQQTIENQISGFFSQLEQSRLPFHQYQIHILELLTVILNITNAYQLNLEEIFGEGLNYISTVLGLHSLGQIQKWIVSTCIKISHLMQQGRMDAGNILIRHAKQFVEENYTDPSVSVERLCDELHVSPAYFSTIFKKEAGTSFVSYLTDMRLEKAIHLLDTTADKTYIIAAKVGYMEPNYFSYVFKKKYGVSPSKYRNRS